MFELRQLLTRKVWEENETIIKKFKPNEIEIVRLFILVGFSFDESMKLKDQAFELSVKTPLSYLESVKMITKVIRNFKNSENAGVKLRNNLIQNNVSE